MDKVYPHLKLERISLLDRTFFTKGVLFCLKFECLKVSMCLYVYREVTTKLLNSYTGSVHCFHEMLNTLTRPAKYECVSKAPHRIQHFHA